jgi:predicted RNA-binding protein YlxR (DUF448 family)
MTNAAPMTATVTPAGRTPARKRTRVPGTRRCIATRETSPREGLIRFVVAPDGTLTPDLAETLPGRGLWVAARRAAIERAIAKKLFGRAAKRPVLVPADLVERLETLLAARAVGLLGLANRAGQLAAGMTRVREWLRAGKAAILLAASDSEGRDGAELRRMAGELPEIRALDSAEMGRAVGRERVVHMAVAPGRLADALRREAARLDGVRGAEEGPEAIG